MSKHSQKTQYCLYGVVKLNTGSLQGKPVFLTHVLPAIPTRTEEEIRDHEEWYQEYLFLNETKKDAIKKWKEKREVIC